MSPPAPNYRCRRSGLNRQLSYRPKSTSLSVLKEMKLSGLVMDPVTNTPIIILKDLEDKNALSIWIGLLEASAIAIEMEKIHVPRPMTHDLLLDTINKAGYEVSRA